MILCPGKASPPLERPVSMSLLLFWIRYPYIVYSRRCKDSAVILYDLAQEQAHFSL